MRSQWKRSEKFDTGSRHFERILKARPHIRDVIPSELAQSSKANALLFCSKFSCELKNLARAVKPEPKRIGKEEWLSLTCLKRTKNCQRSGSNSYVGMRDSCQKTRKCVCVQRAFHRRLFQNWIPIWACGWKHKKEVIEGKCFPTIFQREALVKAPTTSERRIARNEKR